MRTLRKSLVLATFLAISASAVGCAKNVEQVDFTKWGYSFEPQNNGGTRIDTSAQGGASQSGALPNSTNFTIPKASVGGAYLRTSSSSASYRMTGGFHTR